MKKYKKINAKPGPMLYPLPAVMVSCGDMDNSNIITIAWTGIVNSNPPMTYVSIMKSRHSHDIIEKSGEFVINLVNEDLTKAMDYCGVKSGRDVDKFEEMGLTKELGDVVKVPMIAESPVCLECKLTEVKELPSHDMFLAEIVAVHISEESVDEKGAYDFAGMHLTAFNHGKYYGVEKKEQGFFGYSIMKKKTAKKKYQKKSR